MKLAKKIIKSRFIPNGFQIIFISVLMNCGGDPSITKTTSSSSEDTSELLESEEAKKNSVLIDFHYSKFSTNIRPNSQSCSGDIQTPLSPFLRSTRSELPAFLSGVSVDVTDSASDAASNGARNCSMRGATGTPPSSSCATFDFASTASSSDDLQGSVVFFGGIRGADIGAPAAIGTHSASCGIQSMGNGSTTLNACTDTAYQLRIETLPASAALDTDRAYAPNLSSASEPISFFRAIHSSSSNDFPSLGNGASGAGIGPTKSIVLLGGDRWNASATEATQKATKNHSTWVYQSSRQEWREIPGLILQPPEVAGVQEREYCGITINSRTNAAETGSCSIYNQIRRASKSPPARAHFSMNAVPAMGIRAFSLQGVSRNTQVTAGNLAAVLDPSDRLLSFGGITSYSPTSGYSGSLDTYKFNPTLAPEFRDFSHPHATISNAATYLAAWIDTNPWSKLSRLDPRPTLGQTAAPYAKNALIQSLITPATTDYPTTFPSPAPLLGVSSVPIVRTSGTIPLGTSLIGGGVPINQPCTSYIMNNQGGGFCAGIDNPTPTPHASAAVMPTAAPLVENSPHFGFARRQLEAHSTDALTDPSVINFDASYDPFSFLPPSVTGLNTWPTSGQAFNTVDWTEVTRPNAISSQSPMPNLNGMRLVPGFAANHFIVFGGTNCRDYWINGQGNTCPGASGPSKQIFANQSYYWSLSSTPVGSSRVAASYFAAQAGATQSAIIAATPSTSQLSTNVHGHPRFAGMAAAQGFESSGSRIIVAWGGVGKVTTSTSSSNELGIVENRRIYYLVRNTPPAGGDTLTWQIADLPLSTPQPKAKVDATMIYSHVTNSFYLFGGLESGPLNASSETWQLTPSCTGTSPNQTCTFAWKNLTDSGYLSCSPNCTRGPTGRFGHQMVEANLNRTIDGSLAITSNYFANAVCTASSPCSFAIFLEGGRSGDGANFFSDRWLFDPTANAGYGHWSRLDEMPERYLSATVALQYRAGNRTVERAVMFGGQAGLSNPSRAATSPNGSTRVITPLTFGDTLIFNFEEQKWLRPVLLGQGVRNFSIASDSRSEFERRQTFPLLTAGAADTRDWLAKLTPPPLAGHRMVVRTMPRATLGAGDHPTPLQIPQVFLIGGRKIDGSLASASDVWKFCIGTPGETWGKKTSASAYSHDSTQPQDARCDVYHETENASSGGATDEPLGRWMYRQANDSLLGSALPGAYLAGVTYDSKRDRILLYGGIASNLHTSAPSLNNSDSDAGSVYEYTPPSRSLTPFEDPISATPNYLSSVTGTWRKVSACSDSTSLPAGRYDHHFHYIEAQQTLLVVGGRSASGSSLTQTWTADGSSTSQVIPEVWKAYFDATNTCWHWSQLTTFGNTELEAGISQIPTDGLSGGLSIAFTGGTTRTGYYTLHDSACVGAGPIVSEDAAISKSLAGGSYFDLDRKKLGARENLLLQLTFIPLGSENTDPAGEAIEPTNQAYFRVHLIDAGDYTGSSTAGAVQPRHILFQDEERFPKVVHTLSVLAPPQGSIRQEQLILPISIDSSINRIRIERVKGSAIFIDATLHRLAPN